MGLLQTRTKRHRWYPKVRNFRGIYVIATKCERAENAFRNPSQLLITNFVIQAKSHKLDVVEIKSILRTIMRAT